MASGSLSGSSGSLGPAGANIVTLAGGNSGLHGDGKGVEVSRDEWSTKMETQHVARADMNKLIMNYLVTEGFKEAAEKFQKESGVETAVDLNSIDLRIRIKELILQVNTLFLFCHARRCLAPIMFCRNLEITIPQSNGILSFLIQRVKFKKLSRS